MPHWPGSEGLSRVPVLSGSDPSLLTSYMSFAIPTANPERAATLPRRLKSTRPRFRNAFLSFD
jgi:hypothetical protein